MSAKCQWPKMEVLGVKRLEFEQGLARMES